MSVWVARCAWACALLAAVAAGAAADAHADVDTSTGLGDNTLTNSGKCLLLVIRYNTKSVKNNI